MSPREKTIIFSYLQLSNVGCEIIIKGTIRFLERAFPDHDLKFVVPSYPQHVARDKGIFAGLPSVEVIPMLGWKQYLRFLLRKTGKFYRWWTPRFSSSSFRKSDLFVSVGGDIYTIFDGRLPDDWMGYEAFATQHGIPSIMFGANMEKFEVLPTSDQGLLVDHLDKFKLLAVRDRKTADYLGQHGVKAPVAVYPDPVFSLRPACTVRSAPVRVIGLNLSPLALEKFRPDLIDDYVKLVAALVGEGYDIKLIPHVYSSDGDVNLDDRVVLRQIHEKLDASVRQRVTLCEDALGLDAVSVALSGIDLLIGARMHCCLNALTLGKAVLFLEYSVKAKAITDWLRSETPYSAVSDRFRSIPTDQADFGAVMDFVHKVDQFARRNPDPIEIDLDPQLESSAVWPIVRAVPL